MIWTADSSNGTTRPGLRSITLMMWYPNCVVTTSLICAGLQLEGDLVERRDHLALGEVIQVAALRGAAVLRVLLGELGEVRAGLRLLQHRVDLGARLLLRRGVGLLVHPDQDVAGADRFVLLEAVGVLV